MRLRLFCHIIFFLLLALLPVSAHAQCDSRFETFAAAVRTVSELKPNRQNATEYSVQAYWKARERVSTFGISTSYESDVAVDHGMNESEGCSDSRNCEDYVKWYVDYIFRGNNKTDGGPDGSAFYIGRNDLQYKSVLSSIEKWGLALAPFDLDFITDAIGTVYALSNGDYEEGIINLSCIFIPASIDKAAKSAIIGLRAGTHELVSEGGKYLIKKVDLLGLITKKLDTRLVKEFESDFAGASEDVLKRFVEEPELVDAWKRLKEANIDASVRKNIVSLILHNTCKIGRELIPNVKVERIHFGSNDKVVILGSGMSKRIEPSADVLRKEGFSVELFDKECQTKPFVIDGESYTFDELSNEFASIASKYDNNWIPYNKSNSIIINDVQNSLLYKANKQFIERIISEDYTIIHIGQTTESYFCDMENELIKVLKWIE